MIKVALVAGNNNVKLEEALDSKEISVVRSFDSVASLWDEVLSKGASVFVDIHKIIVIPTGMLKPVDMSLEEQFKNLQSTLLLADVRSDLHVVTKSSDFVETVKSDRDKSIIYPKVSLLLLKEIKMTHIKNTIEGRYDEEGVHHPDFNKDTEKAVEMEEEEEEVKKEEVVIPKADYVDTEEKKKEIERKKREEERKKREDERNRKKEEAKRLKEIRDKERQEREQEKKKEVKKKEVKKPKKRRKEVLSLREGVIFVTGDRQSGVSSTVANMAELYAKKGKSVLVIDADLRRRTQTFYFESFYEDILRESRVAQGYLAALNSPRMMNDVSAVVSGDIALLGVSMELDNNIRKFANKPIDKIVNASNMVTLLGLAKGNYDVILVDMPFEEMYRLGESVSYADVVLLCVLNTEHNLNGFLEVELERLLESNDIAANTMMNKAKLLLTRYVDGNKINGKELDERNLMDVLQNMEESILHLEVIGRVNHSSSYSEKTGRGMRAVKDIAVAEEFYTFMDRL